MFSSNRIHQVYLALGPTDLRKSIDGLSILVQEKSKLDPFSRNLYVFCNRRRDKIKILEWDTNGFWLHYKRLNLLKKTSSGGLKTSVEPTSLSMNALSDGF